MKLKSLKAAFLKHACWLSALVVMLAQNSDTCFLISHQPKLPEGAKDFSIDEL